VDVRCGYIERIFLPRILCTCMSNYRILKFPQSRIATFDVYSIGLSRHHVSALLEFDVTDSRNKLRELKRAGHKVSFNAWLIKVIGKALTQHPEVAAYLYGKRKLIVFDCINISIIVEKEINGKKVPIPLVIEKVNEKSIPVITKEIETAKNQVLSGNDIVLSNQSAFYERLYYRLPGIIRRAIWRFMLKRPKFAFKKMGNAVITSLVMMGKINGWFIHKTVHPISFGVGSVLRKPAVVNNEVKVREILNVTILIDHDVIDGAPMVRFINDLTRHIETGFYLDK